MGNLFSINCNFTGDETSGADDDSLLSSYCPFINGVYSFTYFQTVHPDNGITPEIISAKNRPIEKSSKFESSGRTVSTMCNGELYNQPKPIISNCPKGHMINITFQKHVCFSEYHESKTKRSSQYMVDEFRHRNMSFSCLGDWPAENIGERYVALLQKPSDVESQPRYRCAVSQIVPLCSSINYGVTGN